jgi:hypothetical protein
MCAVVKRKVSGVAGIREGGRYLEDAWRTEIRRECLIAGGALIHLDAALVVD